MHESIRAQTRLKANLAAERFWQAALRLRHQLKYNPYWHLQPRVPAGNPDGGQWMPSGPLVVEASFLPILQRLGPWAVARVRDAARRIAPILRRMPRPWSEERQPSEASYDEETRRIGRDSWQRRGEPNVRFRSEDELRSYLGPAGEGREWHHIVEKRLAGRPGFPPERIHSTDNIVNLPVEVHRRISGKMSEKSPRYENLTQRQWMGRFSFEEQYNMGLDLITETLQEMGYDIDHF